LTSNIVANQDAINYENSPTATNSASVLENDFLDGVPATPATVEVTPVYVPPGFTLNADGTFTVALGTPVGNFSISYKICEIANPTNCATAIGSFSLTSNIVANQDAINYENSPTATNSISVLQNDILDGVAATPATVEITPNYLPPGFTLNSDGTFTVALGTPVSNYSFSYNICEIANPTNCATTVGSFALSSNIVANQDAFTFFTPPTTGSTVSVLDNDILNGIAATTAAVTVSPLYVPPGFTLNTDGTVTIPASFTSGNYVISYRICQTTFPVNCSDAIVSIVIDAPFAPTGPASQDIPITKTLEGLQVVGQNILWYADTKTNRMAKSSPLPSSTIVVDDTTYFASQTVNGIESNDRLAVWVTTSLKTADFTFSNLTVYPNPAINNVTISNNSIIDTIEIISVLGQKVFSKSINDVQFVVDVSDFTNGVYLVKLTSQGNSKIMKIIKK
jgi:hypothetical protein